MPIFATNTGTFSPLSIKGIHATGAVDDFLIQNSLRFDSSSSSYLHKTPGSVGNRTTFTFSAWVKRSSISSGQQGLFNAGTNISGDNDFFGVRFFNTDFLNVTTGSTNLVTSTGIFTDVAAWYHIVVTGDTNLSTNKFKIYVNGVLNNQGGVLTDGTELAVGNTNIHEIGRTSWSTNEYFDGYLSEVHYIDGVALSPTDFGEFNSETGIWTPIQYTGATATTGPWPGFSRGSTSSGDTHNTNGNADRLKIDTGVLGDYNITITKSGGTNDIYLESSPDNSSGSYSLIENGLTEVILTNTGTPSHTYDRWVQIQGSGSGYVTVTITGTALGGFNNGTNGVHLNFSANNSSNDAVGYDANGTVRYWPDVTGTNISSTVKNLFDGNTGLSVDGDHSTTITFTPSTPIPYSSSVECYTASGLTERTYSLNGGTGVTNVANGWTTLATGSGTITSISNTPNTNYSQSWSAIRVDGVILTDPNDWTVSGITGLVQSPSYNSTHGSDITEAEAAKIFDGDNATYGEATGDFIGFDYSGTAVTMKVENTSVQAKIFYIQPNASGNFANAGTWSNLSAGTTSSNNWSVPGSTTATATFTFPANYDGDGRIYLNSYSASLRLYSMNAADVTDIMKDSPMSGDASSDTGLGGELSSNYATLNPLRNGQTLSNGNLDVVGTTSWQRSVSTIAMSSGKWYWEYEVIASDEHIIGVGPIDMQLGGNLGAGSPPGSGYGTELGQVNGTGANSSWTNTGASGPGDVIGIAFDADAGNMYVYKNGTALNSGDASHTGLTNGPYEAVFSLNGNTRSGRVNFGATPFKHQAPTGYKCLCAANLADSAISDGTTALSIVEWDGVDGTADTVSGLNLVNDPGFIWTKATNHGYHNNLWDIVRGYNLTNAIITDYNGSATGGKITSVTPSSFSHDGGVWFNENTRKYVAWAWDGGTPAPANSAYKQDEKWSSNVSSYANALGTEPAANLFDGDTSTSFYSNNASGSGIKFVPATSITGSIELYLRNGDTANSTFSYSLDNGSTFTNLTTTDGNGSYVSIGSQTISNTNGIIVKHVTTAGTNSVNWRAIKVDNKVLVDTGVVPPGGSNSQAFDQSQRWRDYLTSSNGFSTNYEAAKVFNGAFDGSGGSATQGGGATMTFTPPAMTVTSLEISVYNAVTLTLPDGSSQEIAGVATNDKMRTVDVGSGFSFTGSNSITLVNNGYVYLERIRINGKELVDDDITINTPEVACDVRANQTAGFSIVKVVNPTDTESRVHGLTKAPEFIMAKATNTLSENWHTFHVAFGRSHYGIFGTAAYNNVSQWGSQEPNPTTFYVKPATGSGANYGTGMIYYIWHSVPGFSAFGSFEGNGLDPGPFVNLGFKPALILLKNGDGNGDWIMHDSTRSPYNEAYKFLRPNSSDGQNTTANNQSIDILSNGFRIKAAAAAATNASVNASSETITYCAWAENPFKGSLAV